MIIDKFVNLARGAVSALSNNKSGFEDLKNAVATAVTAPTSGTPQQVIVVNAGMHQNRGAMVLLDLVLFVVLVIVMLMVGKWLWNNIAAQYITIFKPVPTVWHLLGLVLILDLVHPGCSCSSMQ